MRATRIFAVAAVLGSIAFGGGMLISAAGCSGSGDAGAQATIDPEAQKAAQEKMKEYLKNRPPLQKGPQPAKK